MTGKHLITLCLRYVCCCVCLHSCSFLDSFSHVYEAVQHGNPHSFQLLDDMKNYCPKLSDLVMWAPNVYFLMQIVSFVQYLVTFVRIIHENYPPSQPAQPVPMTQKVVLPTFSQNMVAGCVILHHAHRTVLVTDWICMMKHHSVIYVISCRLRSIKMASTTPSFGSAQSMDIVLDFI